jgi:hypothetical protein
MKEQTFKQDEQKEIIRLARLATGPQIGDSQFWKEMMAHLAVLEGRGMVEPRAAKKD